MLSAKYFSVSFYTSTSFFLYLSTNDLIYYHMIFVYGCYSILKKKKQLHNNYIILQISFLEISHFVDLTLKKAKS